jgi:hypothetical protein
MTDRFLGRSRFKPSCVPTHSFPSRSTSSASTKLPDSPLLAFTATSFPVLELEQTLAHGACPNCAVGILRQGADVMRAR